MFKKIFGSIREKLRLVVSDEDTYEEKFVTKFTILNCLVTLGVVFTCVVVGTYMLISYTSLKEYIPGYDSSVLRKQGLRYFSRVDSLEKVVHLRNNYASNLLKVLRGDITFENIELDSLNDGLADRREIDLSSTKADSTFREQIEQEEMYTFIF